MKSKNVLLVYLFVLIGGILLMLLHNQVHLFEGIVVTCGILFIVPCSYILLSWIVTLVQQKSKKRSKTSETERRLMSSAQWLLPVPIIGGITFGILLVCMPDFFVNYLIYTFGIVMILCGLAQLAFTVAGDACAERQRLVVAASHSRCRHRNCGPHTWARQNQDRYNHAHRHSSYGLRHRRCHWLHIPAEPVAGHRDNEPSLSHRRRCAEG